MSVWNDAHSPMKQRGSTPGPYCGVCRCAWGAEPGAFDYIAATTADDDSLVLEGMARFVIPVGDYSELACASLSDIGRVWGYAGEWLDAHSRCKSCCDGGPDGRGCIEHPSFELHPPGFGESKRLSICVPLRRE